MSDNTTTQTVLNLKEALEKESLLASEDTATAPSSSSMDRCKDVLERLSECRMTLAILTETRIGATVNKQFKGHATLGPTAKALVQSWKQLVAAETTRNTTSTAAATTDSASAKTTATKTAANKSVPKGKAAKTAKVAAAAAAASSQRRRTSLESQSSHNENDDDNDDTNDNDNAPYDNTAEWARLSGPRHAVCTKLYEVLLAAKPALLEQGVGAAAVARLVGPRTAEVERAIYSLTNTNTNNTSSSNNNSKAYADKARSLLFNLKRNQPLVVSLLLGQSMTAPELVRLPAEALACDAVRLQRQETAQRLIDSARLDWNEANEDRINEQCGIKGDLLNASLFTCSRCKSVKTTSTQKQTRSADEPMTVFVLCLNCGKRWKC